VALEPGAGPPKLKKGTGKGGAGKAGMGNGKKAASKWGKSKGKKKGGGALIYSGEGLGGGGEAVGMEMGGSLEGGTAAAADESGQMS
jgi:hypothetical protein